MTRTIASIICVVLLSLFDISNLQANSHYKVTLNNSTSLKRDTLKAGALETNINSSVLFKGKRDSIGVSLINLSPNLSLQQMLKGNIAGLYVQETSGEPGTEQSMIIRGLTSPLFNKNDIYAQQPAIYLNGIPLIQESSFSFDIQKYDFNRIGPATNLLSTLDISNINSIEVIKDPVALAKLGPNAANGAIWITTKAAHSGARQLSVNSYFGIVQPNAVSTTNSEYENRFRQPFYKKYATSADYLNYPGYLRDSTNLDYYGPAKWNDLYNNNSPIHSIDLGLTGGSERANFRFFGSTTRSTAGADNTNLNRYAVSFQINMAPFTWFTVSSMVNATRLDRNRNRNLRDRFAETRYIPDLFNPLAPSANTYQSLLNEYSKTIDDNFTTAVQGYIALKFNLKPFNFVSSFNFDYNQGTRDVFYPTTLIAGNNYVSDYYGVNQRVAVNNAINLSRKLGNNHLFFFEAGQSYQDDLHKYNYTNAYNGPNDFIKINVVNGSSGSGNYLEPTAYLVYRYADQTVGKLFSIYGLAKYSYKDLLSLTGSIRDDGASNAQPGSRWFVTPAFNASWNIKNQFLKDKSVFDNLSLDLSWSRIGKPFVDDRYAAGPQYRVDIGWSLEPTIPGYNGVAAISRPYSSGWVGYDIKWAYTDQFNVGLNVGLLKNRLNASLAYYIKDDKRMLLNVPVPNETGFASNFASGMAVRNTGVDLGLQAAIIKNSTVNWESGLNFNINKNKLTALPNGLSELVIGNKKLKVGEPIDRFWIYQNDGIYNSNTEIEANPANNKPLNFEGTTFKAGDPRWKDQNGDYVINEDDKVLMGNAMPKLTGGWHNEFHYGNFDFNFNVIFAVGQKALNQRAASQYDFINREAANDINSIKEIFFWQSDIDTKKYQIYNPWSSVIPYRLEQNMFLEDASYAKLRSVTLGYTISKAPFFTKLKSNVKKLYVYVTANNLLTVSPFSGADPELVNYNGIYDGYNITIPKTYSLGVKIDL